MRVAGSLKNLQTASFVQRLDTGFKHLVIKPCSSCQVCGFLLILPERHSLFPSYPVRPHRYSPPSIFRLKKRIRASSSSLFILTPDKTHRLRGNWTRGSCFVLALLSGVAINQMIHCVSDGPFCIGFTTRRTVVGAGGGGADATKVLKVCRVHHNLGEKEPR